MFILKAVIILGGIGLLLGLFLAWAHKKLAISSDSLGEEILSLLPGTNCGICGYPGCSGYATAIVKGKAEPNRCVVGGNDLIARLAELLEMDIKPKEKMVAVIFCQGSPEIAPDRFSYRGIKDCNAAVLIGGGNKSCRYGCLGFGSCERACPFGAIHMGENGLPQIDENLCTGCGKCIEACPIPALIRLVPAARAAVRILCNSHDKGAIVRQICQKGCIACGICVKVCPLLAITLQDNLAEIDYQKCDACGQCVEKCPRKTIVWVKEKIPVKVPLGKKN
jgi:electron transport complex protein RnfB